jgi:O-antigen/teichoic acid export membrane protein
MSLKRNIIANYFSQAYVAGISILTVPFYVRFMGTEAFGLIGFYTMLQAWFQLLDAGLSTTLARESSLYRGSASDASTLVRLRSLLERVFWAIGLIGILFFFFFAEPITHRWLQVGNLPPREVANSVQLIGLIIAFRWVSCLYRGVVTGFEQQVWLGSFNVGVATARFLFCLPILISWDASPTTYFLYQVMVSLLEAIGLYWKSNRLLPKGILSNSLVAGELRAPLKFASGVAFTSIVWVLVTQVDKLLLSKLLPLSAYGEFSLAVLLASGINLLAAPIGAALLPRLTNTAASDEASMRTLYARYTQLTCLAMFPAAITFYSCASPVLFAWTGDEALARSASTVLSLYSLGNALMGVASFAYFIQYAKGDIRLHLIGNAILATIYLPTALWVAREYGATGAAAAWLVMNLVYFVAWVPLVHRLLVPGLHLSWISRDVLPVATGAAFPALLLALLPSGALDSLGRWSSGLAATTFFLVSLACAAAGSSILRARAGFLIRCHATT